MCCISPFISVSPRAPQSLPVASESHTLEKPGDSSQCAASFTGCKHQTGEPNVSDERVPAYLKQCQIDFTVIHAPEDKEAAEELCDTLSSEVDGVFGETFDVSITRGGEPVSFLTLEAVTKNIERSTYVVLYLTQDYCNDAIARHTHYQALHQRLVGKQKTECIVPYWAECEWDFKSVEKVPEVLLSIATTEGVNMQSISRLALALRSKEAKEKKAERQKQQMERRNKWKERQEEINKQKAAEDDEKRKKQAANRAEEVKKAEEDLKCAMENLARLALQGPIEK